MEFRLRLFGSLHQPLVFLHFLKDLGAEFYAHSQLRLWGARQPKEPEKLDEFLLLGKVSQLGPREVNCRETEGLGSLVACL